MRQKIIKTGNSLAVTIPSAFAKAVNAKPGQFVSSSPDINTGILTLTFTGSAQLSLISKNNS